MKTTLALHKLPAQYIAKDPLSFKIKLRNSTYIHTYIYISNKEFEREIRVKRKKAA